MDEDIAWEKFQESSNVQKAGASISGKLDTLAQMLAEQGTDTSRLAETVIPEIEGDRGAQDTAAQEMAAGGGMPPGMPPGGMPPDAGGAMPPEGAPEDMPPGGDVPPEGGDMPPMDGDMPPDAEEPPAEMPPAPAGAPEAMPDDMGAEPGMDDLGMEDDLPDEGGEMGPGMDEGMPGMEGDEFGDGGIDWSMFSIDGSFEDFMDSLKDEAKDALDSGDTARVTQITQVMEAVRRIWEQSGLSGGSDMPGAEDMMPPADMPIEQGDMSGMGAPDIMKSEGDAPLDTGEEDMEKCDDIEKSDAAVTADQGEMDSESTESIAESDGEGTDSLDTGCDSIAESEDEGCEKSDDEEPEELEKSEETEEPDEVRESLLEKGLPSFMDLMATHRAQTAAECEAQAFDFAKSVTAEYNEQEKEELGIDFEPPMNKSYREIEAMVKGVVEAEAEAENTPMAKSAYTVISDGRPPSARSGSGDFLTPTTFDGINKAIAKANEPDLPEDMDPLRKSLEKDWANYRNSRNSGLF